MNKYNVGDEVVIRKDLLAGQWYGDFWWSKIKDYLKEKNYVVIERVYDGGYWVEGGKWLISDEMIEGLYK